MACGILVPPPGKESMPLSWTHGVSTTGSSGKSQETEDFKQFSSMPLRRVQVAKQNMSDFSKVCSMGCNVLFGRENGTAKRFRAD